MIATLVRLAGGTAVALLLLAAAPGTAAAHVCMDFPISRGGAECTFRTPQKIGPCGVPGRSEHVNVFRPGQTITVRIRETINHPSHYRIAFNADGDHFPDPVSVDDTSSGYPYVLVDGIEDEEAAEQTVDITFPDVECENCTLQLIQVMYDKQGNGFGGASGGPDDNDDLYYSCADIALRREVAGSAGSPEATLARRGGARSGGLAMIGIALLGIGSAAATRARTR